MNTTTTNTDYFRPDWADLRDIIEVRANTNNKIIEQLKELNTNMKELYEALENIATRIEFH